MTEEAFIRLDRRQRLEAVRAHGEHLGSRRHVGHSVHLYRVGPDRGAGFFCEVWIRLGWNQVEWIEVARNPHVLSEYVDLKPLRFQG